MITELLSLGPQAVVVADLCIVGAGAAGITLARELASSGLKICLVESGGLIPDEQSQALSDGDTVGHDVKLRKGRLRAFGGTTGLWTGRCAPLDPDDFEDRAWRPGWPVSRATLDPYYSRARDYCGFEHPWIDDAKALKSTPKFPLPSLDGSALSYFVWRYAAHNGRNSVNWGMEYEAELTSSRDVHVLLHATLTDFEVSDNGQTVDAIVVRSLDGGSARVQAKAFALCCGGVANAALLLDAAAKTGAPFGNEKGHVGRYFQQHVRGALASLDADAEQSERLQHMFNIFAPRRGVRHEIGWALSPDVKRRENLLSASAIPYYFADPDSGWESAKAFVNGLRLRQITPDLIAKLKNVTSDAEHVAQNALRRASSGRAILKTSRIDLVADLEQAPDADSRVTLSDRRDPFGNPYPKVNWRVSELERATARRFAELLKMEIEKAGLGRVTIADWVASDAPLSAAPIVETYHHIATTRMSSDPSVGVVDPDCRVHGMSNLYVSGCSVFPTGGHANPTLTIVALALRLADHLRTAFAAPARAAEIRVRHQSSAE